MRHLATGRFRTSGCDIRKEALDAAAASGVASACKELAARCDLAIVGIGFDSQIEAAVFGEGGPLAGTRDGLARRNEGNGGAGIGRNVPAPRKAGGGRRQAADQGRRQTDFRHCLLAFRTFLKAVYHPGELGAGQVGEMVHHLILRACISERGGVAGAFAADAGALRDAHQPAALRLRQGSDKRRQDRIRSGNADGEATLRLPFGRRRGRSGRW